MRPRLATKGDAKAQPNGASTPSAAAKIAELTDTLCTRRWGPIDGERRSWAHTLSALVLSLKPGTKLHHILGAAPYDAGDLDLIDTLDTLANLGFSPRRAPLKPNAIDARLLPCLCRPAGAAEAPWVVLAKTSDGGWRVYDSATETLITITPDDPRLGRVSDVWFFRRFDENDQAVSKFVRAGTGHSWFRALLGRFSGVFIQVLATGLALNLVSLSIPLFIMLVYDNVIFSGATELLPGLAVGAALAIGVELLLRRTRARGLAWLAARLDNIVGNKIFAHLLELPPADVERASAPAQIARIKTFESVRDFFCGGAFLSFMEFPFIILTLGLIAAVAGPLVFAPLAFLVGYILLFHLVRRRVKVAIRAAAKASSARQKFAMELFEKLEAIRLSGLEELWARKFRDLSGREGLAHFRLNRLGFVGEIGAHALTVLAGVATVAVGAHLFWAGTLTTGGLVATMILVWRALAPLSNLCTMIPRLEQLRNSIIQVNTLIDLDLEATAPARGRGAFPAIRGAVSVRGVRLRYEETTDPALDGLSFEARPGALVAITGDSGAGKSSLLKLLQALYRPEAGAVLIDGFDARQLDPLELRRQAAYAPQSPNFFTGSVLENLRLGNPLATEEDARRALETICAWTDVDALPEKLNTPIAAHGPTAPPPGLACKLGLARTILHDGRLMLIDELPNALMCGPTGAAFLRWLADTKGKKTVFFITPREDVLALADVVITLSRHGPPHVESRGDINRTAMPETVTPPQRAAA